MKPNVMNSMSNLDTSLIYSVSMLNNAASTLLDVHFGTVWVTGEISNLSRPSSGHLYFSLKDNQAQIRCALFRFKHNQVNFALENGQQVIVQAQVSVYEPRGDFQLIVTGVQLAGAGQLQLAFEKLKNKLEKAGLFDEAHKKALPVFPKQIGIITSPTAAALRDILKVLQRRFPNIPVIIYPTQVQGDAAAKQIVAMIKTANHRAECDVLILARGGGSLEDLWPFNEEIVAHAVYDSSIPIVTGIGHQTDFTIADFVADLRAPTPSVAAECVSPNRDEYTTQFMQYHQRLLQCLRTQMKSHQSQLMHLQKRLQHPGEKLRQQAQTLDQLESHLHRIMRFYLDNKREKIAHFAQLLETLSPLKILQRGFSITREKKSGKLIRHCHEVATGKTIVTQLSDGEIESVVV